MKFVLVAASLVNVSAATGQTISLHPGETVTIRLENGTPVVENRSSAEPISPYEIYALWRAETQDVPPGAKVVPPNAVMEGEGPPAPPHPSGDTLHITMRRVPGVKQGSPDSTALFLSNGYGSALRYHAVMRSGAQSAATDVCAVAPHLLGLEYWPYPLDQLDLSDFRVKEWSGSIECE